MLKQYSESVRIFNKFMGKLREDEKANKINSCKKKDEFFDLLKSILELQPRDRNVCDNRKSKREGSKFIND